MPGILDHLEKTTADSYRKEIDQEENVWRTLPFFIAALSLEIAELAQVKDQVITLSNIVVWIAGVLGIMAFGTVIVAIVYLIRSIAFADFNYVAREPLLVDYVDELQQRVDAGTLLASEATVALKSLLALQYAVSVDINRSINQHRVRMRTTAGIFTLLSLLASLLLGAATVGDQIWTSDRQERAQHGRPISGIPTSQQRPSGATADQHSLDEPAGTAADEGGSKGPVRSP